MTPSPAYEAWTDRARENDILEMAGTLGVISRAEAIANRFTRYFTGKPCCKGHICERVVSTRKCIECVRAYDRARYKKSEHRKGNSKRRYAADPEKYRQMRRDYVSTNIDKVRESQKVYHAKNRIARNTYSAAYHAANRSECNKACRAHYAANREEIREKERQRYRLNPEPWIAGNRNRRARKKLAEGRHTSADVARIRSNQRDKCAYCKTPLKGGGHVDHIIALSKGGSNWPRNIQLLCKRCNLSKRDSDPIDFMQSRGLLL